VSYGFTMCFKCFSVLFFSVRLWFLPFFGMRVWHVFIKLLTYLLIFIYGRKCRQMKRRRWRQRTRPAPLLGLFYCLRLRPRATNGRPHTIPVAINLVLEQPRINLYQIHQTNHCQYCQLGQARLMCGALGTRQHAPPRPTPRGSVL